jgi:hypothetical protein
MDWVRLPCDLQSTGYGTLMSGPGGAQHFGVFIALAEIVADLPIAFRDGRLVSPQGAPLSVRALSIKTRIPVGTMEQSIAALKDCGWLLEEAISGVSWKIPENPGDSRRFPANPGGEGDGEGDGEGEALSKESAMAHFDSSRHANEFIEAYPKATGVEAAATVYAAVITTPELHEELMAGLTRWRGSEQWRRSLKEDGGRFIPGPDRFLSQRLWRDNPPQGRPDAFSEAAKILGI